MIKCLLQILICLNIFRMKIFVDIKQIGIGPTSIANCLWAVFSLCAKRKNHLQLKYRDTIISKWAQKITDYHRTLSITIVLTDHVIPYDSGKIFLWQSQGQFHNRRGRFLSKLSLVRNFHCEMVYENFYCVIARSTDLQIDVI